MKQYTVIFSPEAQDQLAALYGYIAVAITPEIAERYANNIISFCEGLQTFPNRGVCRDDIRPGVRITHYKKRTVIAYAVDDKLVSVIGIFYGGQDYENDLLFDRQVEN
ncbi:MAG: type II toxin-antitoxin system RelE/ParE family toxin [Sideroxydans sp.]|nr:type II toxin-antitoxin system RelE/ParE family toxin [Sideroxydans sp.]